MKIKSIIKRLETLDKETKVVCWFWLNNIYTIKEFTIDKKGINVVTGDRATSEENCPTVTVAEVLEALKILKPTINWVSLKQIKNNEKFCCLYFD